MRGVVYGAQRAHNPLGRVRLPAPQHSKNDLYGRFFVDYFFLCLLLTSSGCQMVDDCVL